MSSKTLPYYLSGLVVRGFGRGSKALGVPTANIQEDVVQNLPNTLDTGVYYGWAAIDGQVHKMVASIGWNPFYKNEKKTVEIHMLQKFDHDFYDKLIKVIFAGYIRPERDFASVDELIEAIKSDIAYAEQELEKPDKAALKNDAFLST